MYTQYLKKNNTPLQIFMFASFGNLSSFYIIHLLLQEKNTIVTVRLKMGAFHTHTTVVFVGGGDGGWYIIGDGDPAFR